MTASILPLHHMYANHTNHFRDPFASRDSHDHTTAWPSSHYLDFNRALTPPPEMSGGSYAAKSAHHPQEHGNLYGDYVPAQQAGRAAAASQGPQEVSNADFGRNDVSQQSIPRPLSPRTSARSNGHEDSQQRDTTTNAIAPSFQIPKGVNDSGGSLSELAAQITCLFWFESSDILQQVEDSTSPIQPTRQLVLDAKPSTGFRKWVTTILATTLVAQNVVLLALLFVHRLKKLNPTVRGKPGSEYRLLTVALMLGNKFLDDNTYTNKTWAEVSGINVQEVHVMEVEFLSNMKYCLFTSAEDWTNWQTLLGKFADFFDRASKLQYSVPILPPASSLHLPMNLPSPPASNQASPPYLSDFATQHGITPAPSPLAAMSNAAAHHNHRKRSRDDHSTEPPPKRSANGYQNGHSPRHYAGIMAQGNPNQQYPRLPLPSLHIPTSQAVSGTYAQPASLGQQLPPLTVPARAMAMVYPNASSQASQQQVAALAGSASQPQSQMPSQHQSRQQSPYPGSAGASPTNVAPQSATVLYPRTEVSPTYFLQQRASPYRPVHNVSTLLYPPPPAALHSRPQSIENSQMHYQPLGKPLQQRQTGRLPYVSQNVWTGTDSNPQQAMTPVAQWPGFPISQSQRLGLPHQHPHQRPQR